MSKTRDLALLAAGAVADWQPIETAPLYKDILVSTPSYWQASEILEAGGVQIPAKQRVLSLMLRQSFEGHPPTHWKPLDDPPQS